MKTAGFLLPASIFGLAAAFAPFALQAAVVYNFDDDSPVPLSGEPTRSSFGQEIRPLAPHEEESLMANLARRVSLTALPPGDPNLFFVKPDGDPRDADDTRLIRQVDRRISELSAEDLQTLLATFALSSESGPDPLKTWPDAPATEAPAISTTAAAKGAVVYTFPAPGAFPAPAVAAEASDRFWPPLSPVPGTDPGPVAASADLRRQTGMYLLQALAWRAPAEAVTQFNAIAPPLATACLKAAPDSGGLKPLDYLSASGDVLAFARSLTARDPGKAIQWYLSHRSLELSDTDTGLTDLIGGIARQDPIVAFALVSRLPAKEMESAADGIAANAKTGSQRTLLVESLRQPRAAAVQAVVLRSIGHQNATTYLISSEWAKQPGFTAEEQHLLKEGSETKRLGDPLLRFPVGAAWQGVPR